MADYVVTNLNSTGTGSFLYAIESTSSGDTITFSVSGTIDVPFTLSINSGVTIDGGNQITLSGQGTRTVFDTLSPFQINTIENLTIINGADSPTFAYKSGAGAILNAGTLTLIDDTFTNNTANELKSRRRGPQRGWWEPYNHRFYLYARHRNRRRQQPCRGRWYSISAQPLSAAHTSRMTAPRRHRAVRRARVRGRRPARRKRRRRRVQCRWQLNLQQPDIWSRDVSNRRIRWSRRRLLGGGSGGAGGAGGQSGGAPAQSGHDGSGFGMVPGGSGGAPGQPGTGGSGGGGGGGGGLAYADIGGDTCFLRGTHILTPAGEVAVEDLCAGDLVLTPMNGARPIAGSASATCWPRADGGPRRPR